MSWKSGYDFKSTIFKLVLLTGMFSSPYDYVIRWITWELTDDKSTLVQVMAWGGQVTGHFLSQPWWRHQMETSSALLAICAGNSPVTHKGQWRGALVFSLICASINGKQWVNNGGAGDLGRHRVHYGVIVMVDPDLCRHMTIMSISLSVSFPRRVFHIVPDPIYI